MHPDTDPAAPNSDGDAGAALRHAVIAAVRDMVIDGLALHRAPERVCAVVAEAAAIAEQLSAESRAHLQPPPEPIACRAGCAWCCHQAVVLVSPPEVFAFVPEAEGRSPGRAMISARTACPLLDAAGLCSIHRVRPLKCRGYTSMDVAACQVMATTDPTHAVPVYWPQYAHHDWVQAGLVLGARDLGLQADLLVLRHAVRFVDGRQGLVHRWLAGADVFPPWVRAG